MTTWKCGVCFEDIEEPDAVCHHCGRILCHKVNVCRFLIPDNAFAGSSSRKAYHCPDCRKEHHSGTTAASR